MMMQLGTLIPFGDIGGDPAVLREYAQARSEEHTSELQSQSNLVCRLLLEKKKQSTTHSFAAFPLLLRSAFTLTLTMSFRCTPTRSFSRSRAAACRCSRLLFSLVRAS